MWMSAFMPPEIVDIQPRHGLLDFNELKSDGSNPIRSENKCG